MRTNSPYGQLICERFGVYRQLAKAGARGRWGPDEMMRNAIQNYRVAMAITSWMTWVWAKGGKKEGLGNVEIVVITSFDMRLKSRVGERDADAKVGLTFCLRRLQVSQAWAVRWRLSSGTLGRVIVVNDASADSP